MAVGSVSTLTVTAWSIVSPVPTVRQSLVSLASSSCVFGLLLRASGRDNAAAMPSLWPQLLSHTYPLHAMLVIQAAASPMSYRRKHARDTGYRGVLSVRCHYVISQ